MFGGEGYRLDDAGEGPSPCVYILDVDNLTWQRCITHSPVEEHSPGTRSLHVTTVRPCIPHPLPDLRPVSYYIMRLWHNKASVRWSARTDNSYYCF